MNAHTIADKAIESVLNILRETGRYDNTLVVLTSDHGEDPEKKRGLIRAFNPFDEVIRIPFMIKVPAAWADLHPDMVNQLKANQNSDVSNMDILPTVLDALGFNTDEVVQSSVWKNMDGLSLFRKLDPSRWIFTTDYTDGKRVSEIAYALVKGSKRFISGSRVGNLYFDVNKSPKETENMWPNIPTSEKEDLKRFVKAHPFVNEVYQNTVGNQ